MLPLTTLNRLIDHLFTLVWENSRDAVEQHVVRQSHKEERLLM